ncbi:MAG TPA: LuxR C-terminal-related transcriptional regulator [Actinocrinis sp.]|uniref:LuxR C-terminal-related transcriptional regulator n=1 Tax=Actinocrinis sp. TaxID=1920516 RepID=UPI002DDD4A92|nr:LuxR C-terminal-related transcriptional regulator [Actinocrinis sp.]HEV3173379.1 LuxR C-terminal-related transcriptional regulator [Actinocrinis sp.]
MARPTRRTGSLPAETTSFVGRRRELAEIRKKLTQARLISLVGPGGVGKTRLAVRAAADLGRGFRDGAWLVELADLQDPALVGSAVMAALGLRDQASTEPLALILSYLREKELLLVVDNCEHLLETAARVVTDVLKAAPDVRVIATSREPLAAAGEHIVPVTPLELPSPDPTESLVRLRQNEAVALFVERAEAASGVFELMAANRATVVELCRRLDGLPLAIELAAVRTRVLAAEQILDRLSDRFSLLTGGSRAALPRHQTLRTTIEWSHDLLTDGERAVLRRACVFAGRFTLDDAEAVCMPEGTPPAQALDLMSSLIDKSLVVREEAHGLPCYRLHETMREYARLKIDEAGERDSVELACTEYFRSKVEPGQAVRVRLLEWLPWADLEIDNIRAVLSRCLTQGDTSRGIELALSLSWFWITRATTEGMRWLGGFLAMEGGDPQLRAWATFIRGFLAVLKAEPAVAKPELEAAAAAARRNGQQDLLCDALSMASVAEAIAGDGPAAARLLAEAQKAVAGIDYVHGRLAVLQARVFNAFFEADLATIRAGATEGVRLSREIGDFYTLEIMLLNLGSAALMAGELAEAEPLLAEALATAHRIDDRVAQFYLLAAHACHATLSGNALWAAAMFGAAETVRVEAGANVMPILSTQFAQAEQAAAAMLGEARFKTEFEAGKNLQRDAAIRLALGESPDEARAGQGDQSEAGGGGGGDADVSPLGKREAEVARLIAEGLTNKQIATRLFISERTVDSHVRSILNKLGFRTRTQIATWVAN